MAGGSSGFRGTRSRLPAAAAHSSARRRSRPGYAAAWADHEGGLPMIWLTWRQFRAQAIAASAALAVVAVALAITGAHLAHLYDTSGMATCQSHGMCGTLSTSFMNQVRANFAYKF